MSVSRGAATAAAEWWAAKIGGNVHHDNGDDSFGSFIAMFMADSLANPATEEQISKFKELLIASLMDESNEVRVRFGLNCDYSPCSLLADAAKEAGISEYNFPYKTSMFIDERGVRVFDGYGASPETIYHD